MGADESEVRVNREPGLVSEVGEPIIAEGRYSVSVGAHSPIRERRPSLESMNRVLRD